MLLERNDGGLINLEAGQARLEAAFLMVMRGGAENDGYNALTLAGGLAWRDVALIRALSRFLRQIRVPIIMFASLGASLVKLGFDGITVPSDASALADAAVNGARRHDAGVVLVAYADRTHEAVSPAALLDVASSAGAAGVAAHHRHGERRHGRRGVAGARPAR